MDPTRAQTILDAHNCARARYGVPPLDWDWSLADTAQRWASGCYWGHWRYTTPQQFPGMANIAPRAADYGENLAAATRNVTVDGWLDEESQWKCPSISDMSAGHFTQMVWKDTKRVGCAVATCNPFVANSLSFGGEYLVCEYDPPGNYQGQPAVPQASCASHRPASDCASLASATFDRRMVPARGGGALPPPPPPAPATATTTPTTAMPPPPPPPGGRPTAPRPTPTTTTPRPTTAAAVVVNGVPLSQILRPNGAVCFRPDQAAYLASLTSTQWQVLDGIASGYECARQPDAIDRFQQRPEVTLWLHDASMQQRVLMLDAAHYDALVNDWLNGIPAMYQPFFVDQFLQATDAAPSAVPSKYTDTQRQAWMAQVDAAVPAGTVLLPNPAPNTVVTRPTSAGAAPLVSTGAIVASVVVLAVLVIVVVVLVATRRRWTPAVQEQWQQLRRRSNDAERKP